MEVNGELPSYLRIGGHVCCDIYGDPIITNQKIMKTLIFDDDGQALVFKEFKFHRICFLCNKMKQVFYTEELSGIEYCNECTKIVGYNK